MRRSTGRLTTGLAITAASAFLAALVVPGTGAVAAASTSGTTTTGAATATASVSGRATPTPTPAVTRTVASPSTTVRALPGDPAVPARYLRQKLVWKPCLSAEDLEKYELPPSFGRLQCSSFLAPLVWSDAEEGADVRIAVSRLPATSPARGRDGRPAAPALFTNPGGPGAPGLLLPLSILDAGRKSLLAAQDVYGIDVRGTGDSTLLTCGGWRQVSIDPRDRRPDAIALTLDLSRAHARSCRLFGRDLVDHVTTAETVADLDLFRRLVQRERINWLGFSAGTWLGAQYATAYPQHVGRFVLDSSTDFTTSWQKVQSYQPMAFQRRFATDLVPWLASHHAYFGLGSTPSAVTASYEALRADLAQLAAADPTALPIDGAGLDYLVASALYSKASFQDAGEIMVLLQLIVDLGLDLSTQPALAQRRAATARSLLARFGSRLQAAKEASGRRGLDLRWTGDEAYDATFYATTCGDTPWTGDAASLEAESEAAGTDYPLLGWAMLDQPCVFWDRPVPDRVVPVPTGARVPPVLMVQSVRDPATAWEGAQHAASTFAGARLLTVTNEGDHGLYASGNACVDTAVESFLLTGALPAPGATCAGTGLPRLVASPLSLDAAGLAATPARPAAGAQVLRGRTRMPVPRASVPAGPRDPLGKLRAWDRKVGAPAAPR